MQLTLRQARMMKDIPQHKLAESVGISEGAYRRIERNPDLATVRLAKDISEKLEVDYNIIFFGSTSSLNGGAAS